MEDFRDAIRQESTVPDRMTGKVEAIYSCSADGRYLSIIDDAGVSRQDLLGLLIEFLGDFMDIVFFFAPGASHPYPPAHAMHLQFSRTLATFHGPSAEQLLPGENCLQGISGIGEDLDPAFLALDHGGD